MLVQRQGRSAMRQAGVGAEGRGALDREIVRGNRRDPAVGDPLEQPLVVAVQDRAGLADGRVELTVRVADELPQSRVDAEDVALLYPNPVGFHDFFQLVVADLATPIAQVVAQIYQHAAPLHPGFRHALYAQRDRAELALRAAAGSIHDLVAVVADLLRSAVALGIEL